MKRNSRLYQSLVGLLLSLSPNIAGAADPARDLAAHIVSVSGDVMIRQQLGTESKEIRPAVPGKEIWVGDIITTPSNGRIKLLLKDRSIMDLGPSSLFRMDQLKIVSSGEREVDATIAYGTLRTGVTQKLERKSHFKVRTASATMGVRGTEFFVRTEMNDLKQWNQALSVAPGVVPSFNLGTAAAGSARTEVTVLQGKVEVGTPQSSPTLDRSGIPISPPVVAPATLMPGMQLVAGGLSPSSDRGMTRGAPEIRKLDVQKFSEVVSSARVPDKTFEQATVVTGTTRDEEALAKRQEKREEPAAQGQPSAPGESAQSSQAERTSDGKKDDSRVASSDSAGNSSRAPAADGAAPSKSPDDRPPAPQSPISGNLAAIAAAVNTNVQVAIQTTAQTIRTQDVITGALSSTSAITQRNSALQNIHTLTIRFTPPTQ